MDEEEQRRLPQIQSARASLAKSHGHLWLWLWLWSSFTSVSVAGLIPEFLSYKTCAEAPPAFSGCMSNVSADIGSRVVLTCQVHGLIVYLLIGRETMASMDNHLPKTRP
jgi:hypothetical protein